ncbi:MAG TPA: metallophosphoesterase [Candidatus Mcinerneyibacteriales bacterium]|nr:metallophosphoesterase [Candidatus Mcinerneyibacteriales bacterium]
MPIYSHMRARKRILAEYIEAALDRLTKDPRIPSFPLGNKYLVVSDFHLGDKSKADNFRKNEEIALKMLEYYSQKGYYLIINGDFEELWQFSSETVRLSYSKAFRMIKYLFGDKIIRIYGNHDDKAPWQGLCPGIFLRDKRGEKVPFLVTHGHLGSRESDLYSWFSRLCVRLFRLIEPFCLQIGLIKAPVFKRASFYHDFEHIHDQWARKRGYRIICGHSHRAAFASTSYFEQLKRNWTNEKNVIQKVDILCALLKEIIRNRHIKFKGPDQEGFYFNCGCGLYKKGITALEIDPASISLVKWEKRGTWVYNKMPLN